MTTPSENGLHHEDFESRPVSTTDLGEKQVVQDSLDTDELGPAPDGGARAWLVVAGGWCIFFCCLGFTSAFGVFQEFYFANQLRGQSHDKIAWIGSVSSFIQFSVGAFSGPLFDRIGPWV